MLEHIILDKIQFVKYASLGTKDWWIGLKIPREENAMSFSELSLDVQKATLMATAAGEKIVSGEFVEKDSEEGEEKDDPNVGHHAIVTSSDTGAQRFLVANLALAFPQARFIVEEKSDACKERIITDASLRNLSNEELVFNIDPIDGTSSFNGGLYEWAVSIGVMRQGLYHAGGAIYAPDVRGGMLVYGERGKDVFLKERGREEVAVKIGNPSKKGSFVYIGPDIFFMLDRYGRFLNTASKEVRTTNCNGSCVLSLAGIAAGKIAALIQPVQCPWDWAAGYPLVEEAGGKMVFYDYANGKPEKIELTPRCYSSTKRNAAFIAGNPEIVDWLWALLQENWMAPL